MIDYKCGVPRDVLERALTKVTGRLVRILVRTTDPKSRPTPGLPPAVVTCVRAGRDHCGVDGWFLELLHADGQGQLYPQFLDDYDLLRLARGRRTWLFDPLRMSTIVRGGVDVNSCLVLVR